MAGLTEAPHNPNGAHETVPALTLSRGIHNVRSCNGVVVESQLAQGTMVDAFRAVIGGGPTYHPPRRRQANTRTLTDREAQVLQLLMQGYTNREMVEALSVSAKTIKTKLPSSKANCRRETGPTPP